MSGSQQNRRNRVLLVDSDYRTSNRLAGLLRDDGFDYAARLRASGAPVRVVDCDGMIHGFLRWTGEVPAARRWIDSIATAAREMMQGSKAMYASYDRMMKLSKCGGVA